MDMKERLQELAENARKRIEESEGLDKLNDVRVAYLGKKGELTAILKGMKDVAPEERPKVGQLVNETRAKIEELLEASKKDFEEKVREEKMKAEVIDVTLPAKKAKIGHRHPNTIALEEVERIFIGMGYEVVEGPEVEYADYNFTKLNIPENHPARDEQDTFFINDSILLRSQTSPVQAREMEKGKLPIRMIAPGRVFRSDEVDATHSPSFHQIEGLVIDKNVTFADLKGTLQEFAKELFGDASVYRLRDGGMGSEDFASYTYELPCAYLLLGAGTAQEDSRYGKPMHNPKVIFNEDILPRGAALHTLTALRYLEQT